MRLGVGGAQFGFNYGISNSSGITPPKKVLQIVKVALENDVTVFDTAPSYRESESVLGEVLESALNIQIITKVPKVGAVSGVEKFVMGSFLESLKKLRRKEIYGILTHDANDLLGDSGSSVVAALEKIKREGSVKKIGVSVYGEEQLQKVMERFPRVIDLVQVPINIFDQRLVRSGFLKKLKSEGVEIHGRSLFLQGLLLMEPSHLPKGFEELNPVLVEFRNKIKKMGLTSIEACLGFVDSLETIDVAIIGVNNCIQFKEILNSLKKKVTWEDFKEFDLSSRIQDPLKIIDPSQWVSP
jgi:aryl-alcohol dehydrogenase-like predicted oxidoreductase